MTQPTKQEIVTRLSALLADMVADWDLDFSDPMHEGTRIVADLGFESVDIMQLIVAVEQAFGTRGLPFDRVLMEEGGYVNEITIGELADFLHEQLGAR